MNLPARFSAHRSSRFLASCLFAVLATAGFAGPNRLTVLTDAFGRKDGLELDWGYAALIEFDGRRILFDTGNNAALLQRNLARMKVDLSRLDAVIISHAHGDHTSGLRHVMSLNPGVKLYVPDDPEFRGRDAPPAFFATNPDPSLPPERRYFRGNVPFRVPAWLGWSDTNLTIVKERTTLAPGVHLVATASEKPPFVGLQEVSLVLDTPKGRVVVAGCSHPGIERIMAAATTDDPSAPVYLLFGGLHLVQDTRAQITQTLDTLANKYRVQKMAVGHCTSEVAFSLIRATWGDNDLYAGLGETIEF